MNRPSLRHLEINTNKIKKAEEEYILPKHEEGEIALKPVVSCLDGTMWLASMNWV
jgi:hypothetical protein